MLRFSKKVDYTVLLITDLVEREEEVLSAAALAEKYSLSPDFIANIMKTLAKKGFVKSVRGKKGGYKLSMNPEEVSLMDLIEAVDGPVSLTDCSEHDHHLCAISHLCRSKSKMIEITRQIHTILDDVKLDEILEKNNPLSFSQAG